eukprot:364435-Chlamydomonas_euryale.AAC.9
MMGRPQGHWMQDRVKKVQADRNQDIMRGLHLPRQPLNAARVDCVWAVSGPFKAEVLQCTIDGCGPRSSRHTS